MSSFNKTIKADISYYSGYHDQDKESLSKRRSSRGHSNVASKLSRLDPIKLTQYLTDNMKWIYSYEKVY